MLPADNWPIKTRLQYTFQNSIASVAFLLLLVSGTFAQVDSAAFSMLPGSFEIPRNERIDKLAPTGSGGPIVLSSQNGALFIRPIDLASGKAKTTLSIRSNDTKKVDQYEHRGDSIFALVRTTDRAEPDWYECVIYTLTGDSLTQAHRHTIDIPSGTQKNPQPIYFRPSSNGKYNLVCRQSAYVKGASASVNIEISAFPENDITPFTLPLPFDADDLTIAGASIDNKGIVYLAAKTGIKLNSPFMRKYLVYSFNPKTKELHEFDLSADKIFVQDMSIFTRDSSLQVTAFYSTDPFSQSASNGYLFVQIDSAGAKVVKRAVNAFRAEMVTAQQGGEGVSGNMIDDLVLNASFDCNASPVLIMDKQYRDQICTTDPRTGIITCTDQFHFEGISIEHLTDRNKSVTLGRRQIDYDKAGQYVSHQSYQLGKNIVVLYNDHYKNESVDAERIMNNPGRSVMRYYVYSCDGPTKSKLISDERSDYVFVSTLHGYHSKRDIMVLYSSGRDYKIAVLNVDALP